MCKQEVRHRKDGAPKAPEPARESRFGRFKERSFGHALALAKTMHAKGWGAVVGSEKVKARLEAAGISDVVLEPGVAYENEILLNRARDCSESNFFVFVKFGTFKTTAFFTEPTNADEGRRLRRKQILRKRNVWRSSNKSWVENTTREIEDVEGRKARSKFFAVVHGHWGENEDIGRNRDDGVSLRKDVIRQFMLWHYDIDATGYHNWIHKEAIEDISAREDAVGIRKIPSLEFTMPFNEGSENGPHLNFWFRDLKVATWFWEKFIRDNKHSVMPGLAPNVRMREVLKATKKMRNDGDMALGVAHPSCILNVGIGRLPVGLLNLLNERDKNDEPKYNWKAIWTFVKVHADAVGLFNPTLEDYPLHFENGQTEAYFRRKVDVLVGERTNAEGGIMDDTDILEKGIGEQMKPNVEMRENSVSYAFARRMEEKFGKVLYMDHDLHIYGKTRRYWRLVSPLAYGRTAFTLDEAGMDKLRDSPLEGKDFVEMMHGKTFRGDSVVAGAETFLELEDGRLRPVAPRRDILYSLRTMKDKFLHAKLTVKLVWNDLRVHIGRMFTTSAGP
ncbi:hypothetical protein JW721_01185 [Candidatus Micrarchaeota archaeon]|nr:hypothetical protein [Candidatus Micrarchaeota archaeon]